VKVVSVINYKGGVGKTTLTANLGATLASRGYRVLLIDLDPQSSLTFSFFRPQVWRRDLADGLTIKRWFDEFVNGQGDTNLSDLVVTPAQVKARLRDPDGKLDLIASHLGLINVDLQLVTRLVSGDQADSGERWLEVHRLVSGGLAERAFSHYDLALIDCPPNVNIVTKAAIIASDYILVPSRADDLSTLGTEYLFKNVRTLVDEYNDHSVKFGRAAERIRPSVLGVVFTMVRLYGGDLTSNHKQFVIYVRDTLRVPVFATTVRDNPGRYGDASSSGVPLAVAYSVPSQIAREFNQLADEFLRNTHIRRK
jgi:chromosome partitioning protein